MEEEEGEELWRRETGTIHSAIILSYFRGKACIFYSDAFSIAGRGGLSARLFRDQNQEGKGTLGGPRLPYRASNKTLECFLRGGVKSPLKAFQGIVTSCCCCDDLFSLISLKCNWVLLTLWFAENDALCAADVVTLLGGRRLTATAMAAVAIIGCSSLGICSGSKSNELF